MASNDPPGSPNIPRGLLGRKGTPVGAEARLTSLRGPRDLTLGGGRGAKKKTFQPNIPARREKKDDAGPSGHSSNAPSQTGRGRRGERGARGRGRGGRGRGEREVIQSHSIFEEGPTGGVKKSSTFGDRDESYSSGSLRGSSSVKHEKKSKEETKQILDHLLRDDFVVDEKLDTDDPTLAPVRLPMGVKIKIDAQNQKKLDSKPDVKIKAEPMDETDSVAMETDSTKSSQNTEQSDLLIKTAADLFTKASDAEHGEFMFFQLPDTLPGDPSTPDDRPSSSQQQKKDDTKKNEKSTTKERCVLADFNEGFIGKLHVHKSGRTRLILGNTALDLSLGTPPGFLQNLASLRIEEDSGDLSILGPVRHKLLCVPDFENMLDER